MPTKNRFLFLNRVLHYYSNVDFKGIIYIGDSSDTKDLRRNKSLVESLKNNLKIIHKHYPNINPPKCTKLLVEQVRTKYSVLCNDDDFLVPDGLERCIKFLENNYSYASAHGKAISIKTQNSMPHSKIVSCVSKRQPIEEADKASDRWIQFMPNLSDALFSVHRTDDFRLMYSFSDVRDGVLSGCILPNALSIISGKIKELNGLSLVRHMQDNPYRTKEETDFYFWIKGKDWLSNIEYSRDILAKELMFQDKIKYDAALKVVDKGMSLYIAKRFTGDWEKYLSENSLQISNLTNSRFDVVKRIKNIIKKSLFSSPIKTSNTLLKSLLNPSSSYHKDFMPIYHAITEEEK